MCGQWRLDQQDLDTYRSDGLLKLPFRIADEQLGRMRESLDQLMSDNAHLAPETLVCPHIPYGKTQDEAAAREWLEYARHPGILDLVSRVSDEDRTGPE